MILALKYRPKKFDEIVGQSATIKTLSNSLIKNRIANAYLFSGLRGSGKTSTARVFAKSLQCEKGPTPTPCEECQNCIMANENRHLDIIEIDAASNRKIEDIRHLIEETKYKPTIGRFKIFIIDEVHMLTNEAFNALLKTLEEPPEYIKFILATTDPLKLPATILSRVQHFRFNKIKDEILYQHLVKILIKENIEFEDKAIKMITKAAKGSLRDALTLTDQAIAFSKDKIDIDNVSEMLGAVNPEIINEIFRHILNKDKENIKKIINEIKEFDIESIIDEIILFLKDALYNESIPIITTQRFFNIIADSKELIKQSVDNEFILSLMFLRMIEATKSFSINEMIKNLERKTDINSNNLKTNEEKFSELIKELKLKDIKLGVCFEASVKFISLEDNILKWESCPDEECKNILLKTFASIIRPSIEKIFSKNIQIKPIRCQEEKKEITQPPKQPHINEEEKLIKKIYEIFGTEVKIKKIKN